MGSSDLNRRDFAVLAAAAAATGLPPAEAQQGTSMLYPGEELTVGFGVPALVRFEPGRPGFPLVVFVTGGGVLGRIAYGPPTGRAADFLCHWLQEEGFATLCLSYPLDRQGVFDTPYPYFSMTDWAEQSAEIISRYVNANALADRVVVLGWSMAGRIAEPLNEALQRRGTGIELFVAMAGASALPNILPGLKGLRPASSGLAMVRGAYLDWLLLCLADQNRNSGRTVLDAATFVNEMTGDFPIGLAASAMRLENGIFVPDGAADAHEVGASRYGAFPPLAVMTHASAIDARRALTDRAAWGVFITQQLCETHVFSRADPLSGLSPDKWTRVVQHVQEAATQLSMTLPGNHMFFIGEEGAKQTVMALNKLRTTAAQVSRVIAQILG